MNNTQIRLRTVRFISRLNTISTLFLMLSAMLVSGIDTARAQRQTKESFTSPQQSGISEYNARNEFALTQGGTTGVWRYGYSASQTDNAFTEFVANQAVNACGGQYLRWAVFNSDTVPQIGAPSPGTNCSNIVPDSLFIHPGPTVLGSGDPSRRAVVRWTAPAAGTFQLTGALQRSNLSATVDLKIIKNAASMSESVVFSGSNVSTFQIAYNVTVTVAQGETLDFSVGDAGAYQSDGANIVINISQPATACQTAPANLQVFVPGENSPSDVQSVNTNASLVGDASYTNTGKVSRAFDLDGAGDYVRIEDNAAQRPATAVTAEGWFKFDSASGIVALISKPIRGSVLNSYTLYLDGGQLRGLVGNASQFTRANSSFSPQTGVWHHLAFTYDFSGGVSTLKLYANGTDVTSSVDGTPNLLPTYDANPYPLLIGGEFENDAPGFFLDGQADEVSVYGRALAQPEIFDIVQQGSFGKCPPPSCVQAPQGLVSSYSGEQNALDSRSNNHGIFTNAAYTNGKTGQAFNFNGTNSFVAAPDDNSLDITDDLTLEAWIRPTSYNPDGSVIVSKRDVNNFNVTYVFFMESDGRLNFSSRQNGNFSTPLLTTVAVPLNQFSHVAVTVQGSTAKIFIDGVERASTGSNPTRTASDGRLTIGAAETAGCGGSGLCGFFPGQIDELSIYNRGLSISELQSIIAAGQSGKCKPVGLNPPSNQIAWFTADGETIDFMGLNPAGILRGDAGYRPGRVAQAFNFDGNGDYITTADSPNWDFGTGNFAVEGWFKSPAPTGTQRMISAGSMADGANNLWSFGYGDNPDWGGGQRLNFAVFNGGGYSDFSSNPVAFRPNTWHHIAVVRSGSSFNFYLDGALIGTVPVGAGFAVNGGSTGAIIGARYNNNPSSVFEFANGMLDEVSLYSRGLSASEIAAVYNAGVAGKLKGMANNTVPQFAPVLNEKQEREGETNQLRSIVELSDVTVNFFQATSVGTTTQSGIDLAFLPPLPSTVAFTGLAYDISTTATYTGGVHVCFNLPSINDATRFSRLRILHLENIGGSLIWVNRTANLQFASRTACTNSMSSLSPFAIVEGVAPTAASVTLSGRVQTSNGRGIRNARITMTDSAGQRRTVLTGAFGNYRITDVSVGQTVTIEAFAKKFSFVEPVQVVRVSEELREINFTSEK